MSRVSRLVYDCNRPPSAKDAIPEKSETIDAPGNHSLSDQEKAQRATEIYDPFRTLLRQTLDRLPKDTALVTIHSFAPVWYGQRRDVELGLLHDADDRLAISMHAIAPNDVDARLNAPYSAKDGVTHSLREHAVPRGLRNVMIEVRNDLISTPAGVTRFADILSDMLTRALTPEVST